MDNETRVVHLSLGVKMMRRAMHWIGLWKDQFSENVMHCGGNWKDHQPGADLVLDHIVLDLTGDSVPLDKIADASVKKAFKKKKRLLRHSNTLLFSRLGIMALVAVMLVVTTLLTWYFTSTYSARSVNTVASVLRQQLLRTSTQAMVSILGEIYNGTLVLTALHQQVYVASPNATWDGVEARLQRLNRGYFNAQLQYFSVAFVAADGHVIDYTRSNGTDYYFFVNETSSPNPIWYYQNVTGYVNNSLAPPPKRRYPPYPISASTVLSMEPLEVHWTIRLNTLNEAVVSPAVPARDLTTHAFLGAVTITSTFQYLNTYLATVDLLGGFLYFEWYNGTGISSIVAFSYNQSSDILVSPENSSNPVVRAAAQFLSARDGMMVSPGESHAEDVTLAGQKYYIDTARVLQPPYDALNLTAVMIVPRSNIMGRIDKWNQFVIRVIAGTSIGVLFLGCCFICFITSRMSTEMQLRQELIRLLVGKHRAEQCSNYKTQFLANMSHELRTPIAGIIGLLDLLSCDSLTSEQEFSVSQIRRCATGLLALVNNVLDISKVEAGRMELEIAPLSVADELESLVDMFAAQSVDSNIDIVLDLSDNIPLVVRGDSTRIRQIFSNLLSNSMKFTTKGHVLLRGWVDQSLLESTGRQTDYSLNHLSGRERVSGPLLMSAETQLALVFEVEDSGCGIPPELHETVFDSFVQGDSSTTRTHGGSGLGLYIVRSLVELMGGEVAVVATEGQKGCIMRFHIIVERAFDPMPGGHRSSAEGQALGSPHSERDGLDSFLGSSFDLYEPYKRSLPEGVEGTHVLVAMEEGVARNVAVDWLERCGLKVTCVEAWAEVIPTLENICKNASVEPKSGIVVGTDDPGGGGIGSLSFPSSLRSPESISQGSEEMPETVNCPSVLALVDVTLLRCMKVDLDTKLVDSGVLGPKESNLTRSELEKLPSHMQDMLDGMLRIHFQRSVAVSWVVGPDCGAKWKQALQADGCFLVLNKPLHGSRLRRLLSFLARAGKLEQNHWEVHSNWELHSNSMFGSPLSPMIPFPEVKRLEKSYSLDGGRDLVQYAKTPSLRTSIFRKRSLDEARTERTPESVVKDTGLEGSSENAPQSVRKVHSHEEPSVLSENQKAETIPKGTFDTLSNSSEIPRKIQPDEKGNLYVQPKTLNRTSSGLQRYQKVSPVDIPYGPDESRSLLSISTPESPLSGRSTPEISGQSTPGGPGSGVNHPEGEIASAGGVQEMRKNGVHARDLDEQFSGRVSDLGLSRKLGQKPEGQTSHEKPFVRPDRTNSPASAFIHKALSGMDILLVEDTAVLQRLVSMTLKKLGANVTVVGDGLQAVIAVAETVETTRDDVPRPSNIPHFDLILMDCAMPVMDGYNATKAIREAEENTDRHIPIVALTAHALASDEERCLSVGMDAYLTKPIDCKLMVTTIRGLLSKEKTGGRQ